MKPTPARTPESAAPATPKPTPARALAEAAAAEQGPSPGGAPEAADVAETALEVDGSTWTVRVLGRSGRAGDRAPPLILLGFWEGTLTGRAHDREATVVARTLAEIVPSRLEEALAEAAPPPPSDRSKPFFDGVGQGRRGGGPRRDAGDV